MTCNNKCIHYPVCEQKNYDFANIEECPYYYDTPTVEPKTDILEQIIAEINTSNRGTCDYYIVDRIEEIINEYQKGGAE